MTPTLPGAAYELLAPTAAFALSALHARRALGASRAAGELVVLVAYGYALEWVAIAVFASHEYGASWRAAPGGVPLAVAVTWAAVIASAMAIAARLAASPLARAAAAALTGISLDLLMEPVAVRAGLWAWTPPGPWLAVPVGNFVGWAVIVGAYTFGAERWSASGTLADEALRRVALGVSAVVALLAVGFLWRRLDAESAFAGAAAWLVAGLALAATVVLASRGPLPPDPGPGLAARLGAAPGRLPGAVLLLLAAFFATDALLMGDPRLAAVAFGSLLALGTVAWRAAT